MNKYVIVSFLEKNSPVVFSAANWPMHMTLIRPFLSQKDADSILTILKTICSQTKRITLTGKSREMFGHNKNIPVTELGKTQEIGKLHNSILGVLKDSIEFTKPHFNDFRPHITNHNDKISIGDKVVIDSISIVQINGEERKVLNTLYL